MQERLKAGGCLHRFISSMWFTWKHCKKRNLILTLLHRWSNHSSKFGFF